MLADFFDGKEDEEAQKTFQKFSQEKKLNPHITKADLVDNITENVVVLDICRIPWSWTYE